MINYWSSVSSRCMSLLSSSPSLQERRDEVGRRVHQQHHQLPLTKKICGKLSMVNLFSLQASVVKPLGIHLDNSAIFHEEPNGIQAREQRRRWKVDRVLANQSLLLTAGTPSFQLIICQEETRGREDRLC